MSNNLTQAKTTDGDWIRMEEREPTEADLPVWGTDSFGEIFLFRKLVPGNCTHWQRARVPEPPKREPTQAEKDEAALVAYDIVKYPGTGGVTSSQRNAWNAALAYERAEIAKLLPDTWANKSDRDAMAAIVTRVKGATK